MNLIVACFFSSFFPRDCIFALIKTQNIRHNRYISFLVACNNSSCFPLSQFCSSPSSVSSSKATQTNKQLAQKLTSILFDVTSRKNISRFAHFSFSSFSHSSVVKKAFTANFSSSFLAIEEERKENVKLKGVKVF
jgi:hypothetical protein